MTAEATHDEIDRLLAPIKEANPGITNGEIVNHLPERLKGAFWDRILDRHLETELAALGAEQTAQTAERVRPVEAVDAFGEEAGA